MHQNDQVRSTRNYLKFTNNDLNSNNNCLKSTEIDPNRQLIDLRFTKIDLKLSTIDLKLNKISKIDQNWPNLDQNWFEIYKNWLELEQNWPEGEQNLSEWRKIPRNRPLSCQKYADLTLKTSLDWGSSYLHSAFRYSSLPFVLTSLLLDCWLLSFSGQFCYFSQQFIVIIRISAPPSVDIFERMIWLNCCSIYVTKSA